MKSSPPPWQEIADAYRAGDWHRCVLLARALVDDDPYDLSTRALLAALYLKSNNRNLALLQYERLLPLAVGQGDFLMALCTQKRLDELHPSAAGNADRYRAMHEWFRYLVPRSRRKAGEDGVTNRVSPEALIGLSDDAFAMAAEGATIYSLDFSPRSVEAENGMLWVVYFGRVQWSVPLIDGSKIEETSGEGEALVLPAAVATNPVEVRAVVPSECIAFAPSFADALNLRMPKSRADAVVASASSAPERDTRAEPAAGMAAGFDRRKETRMAVNVKTGVALIGEAGSRTAPLNGKLLDLTRTGACVAFPSAQLRQSGGIYPDDLLPVRLAFASDIEPLILPARVAWVRLQGSGEMGVPPREARMGLEWVSVQPEKRSRLVHFLDEAARSGLTFSA